MPVSKPKPAPSAERILEGAARAFGKLGYAAVRVEDILLEAGVSRPTFYKLYRTKEEVFQLLAERHHREIRELIRSVPRPRGVEPLLLVNAVVAVFLRWRMSLGAVGRVLDVEARAPRSPILAERTRTLREMSALMNEWLVQEGRAAVDPVLIGALIATLEHVADALLSGSRVAPDAFERAQRIGVRVVAGALAGPADVLPPLPVDARTPRG